MRLVAELDSANAVVVDSTCVSDKHSGSAVDSLDIVACVANGENVLEDAHDEWDVLVFVVVLELLEGKAGSTSDEHDDGESHDFGCRDGVF